ncbi:MAG: DUF4231 domain-containing protein [Anaerolineae bacterium]|nr:DUF4231 domain-containing protein [Anaerolineae bacterium]
MSDESKDTAATQTGAPQTDPPKPASNQPEPLLSKIWKYFWDIAKSFFYTIQALIFLIFKTPYILLPSATHTSIQDDHYNRDMNDGIKATVRSLDLDETQKSIIIDNWLDQVRWTNDRSTRERDANEIIRWWQIILGVIIPVLANNDAEANRLVISLAGIFVAVLTAVYQFRRPEERWRHYRLITERYLNEIWAFIALSGSTYEKFVANKDYKGAFPIFHDHMTQIRQEDITKFFGEVVRPANKSSDGQIGSAPEN